MEKLLIIRLRIENEIPIIESDFLYKHENQEYETIAMIKGFDKLDGSPISRRVYKKDINVIKTCLTTDFLIELKDGEWGRVYCHKKDEETCKKALFESITGFLNETVLKIESFLDKTIELERLLNEQS